MDLKLTDIALKDFVYKQNPDNSYIFDVNGDFLLEDRNAVIDTIISALKKIYTNIVNSNKINPGEIMCNVYILDQALTRYSRDIFGKSRLFARVNRLKKLGVITETQKEQLSRFYDYGLKTDSVSPYIHRKLAVLLYWLSVLKPFSVYSNKGDVLARLGVAFEFHNEYISYLLCLAFLKAYDCSLSVHKNKVMFYDFLYDLHFRRLSRSSLEFFLQKYVTPLSA
jgi:hypothetical protein